MSRRQAFLLCAASVLSSLPRASEGKSPAEGASAPDSAPEHGLPALFAWGDIEGDGRLDLAAVGVDGILRLLASVGDGRFEDVTERVGLSGIENAALALWIDYDADGRLDLFVGARSGASRLFHNEGGIFVDMSPGSGLESEGAVQSAQWLDHDGDGRLDLFLVTAEKSTLFHGLEGGFFEVAELPLTGAGVVAIPSGIGSGDAAPKPPSAPSPSRDEPGRGRSGSLPGVGGGKGFSASPSAASPPPSVAGANAFPFPGGCATSVQDQANPSSCLLASTTPALGKLYPLSTNLFVAVGGNVGVGTTSPTAKLHVAGTARVTDTLTLAPSGDQALDVSTGSIYKGGALFIHTKGQARNTALGREALASVSSVLGGIDNTAAGHRALSFNTSGHGNTAHGAYALTSNTEGYWNTASGAESLADNIDGNRNTASGFRALFLNTTGSYNTACGDGALFTNDSGNGNTANGLNALAFNTVGSYNTACGLHALLYNEGSYNTATGVFALEKNTTGSRSSACGAQALRNNTIGTRNAASGYQALRSNTTGSFNAACGEGALRNNTTGNGNTASGLSALYASNGSHNTANGNWALRFNTSGSSNTACGKYALRSNNSGSGNIALGANAGSSLTTGSNNIAVGHSGVAAEGSTIRIGTAGTQTRAFVAGIRGVTTGVADAITVMIDSSGQLGTVSSSRRFKEEIQDMGDASERLLELRPVTFRYKPEVQDGERPLEYGLIAEEVADVFPELVVHDEDGRPFTVKYHLLSAMLLNELQEQEHQMKELHARLATLEGQRAASGSRPETP